MSSSQNNRATRVVFRRFPSRGKKSFAYRHRVPVDDPPPIPLGGCLRIFDPIHQRAFAPVTVSNTEGGVTLMPNLDALRERIDFLRDNRPAENRFFDPCTKRLLPNFSYLEKRLTEITCASLQYKKRVLGIGMTSEEVLSLQLHQDIIVQGIRKRLQESEDNKFLIGVLPRGGKTYIAGGCIRDTLERTAVPSMNVLWITAAPNETKVQVEKDLIGKFSDFKDFNFVEVKDTTDVRRAKPHTIYFLSSQLLTVTATSRARERPFLDDLLYATDENKIHMVFYDEAHKTGAGEETKAQITRLLETHPRIPFVFLTATYYRVQQEYSIARENTFIWDYTDVLSTRMIGDASLAESELAAEEATIRRLHTGRLRDKIVQEHRLVKDKLREVFRELERIRSTLPSKRPKDVARSKEYRALLARSEPLFDQNAEFDERLNELDAATVAPVALPSPNENQLTKRAQAIQQLEIRFGKDLVQNVLSQRLCIGDTYVQMAKAYADYPDLHFLSLDFSRDALDLFRTQGVFDPLTKEFEMAKIFEVRSGSVADFKTNNNKIRADAYQMFHHPESVEAILTYLTPAGEVSNVNLNVPDPSHSILQRIHTLSRQTGSRFRLQDNPSLLIFMPSGRKGTNIFYTLATWASFLMSKPWWNSRYEVACVVDEEPLRGSSGRVDLVAASGIHILSKDIKQTILALEERVRATGKGLVVLAGEKLSMGVSLPFIDVVLLLNDKASPDDLIQKLYRAVTPSPGKKTAFIVDLNPKRILSALFTYTKISSHRPLTNQEIVSILYQTYSWDTDLIPRGREELLLGYPQDTFQGILRKLMFNVETDPDKRRNLEQRFEELNRPLVVKKAPLLRNENFNDSDLTHPNNRSVIDPIKEKLNRITDEKVQIEVDLLRLHEQYAAILNKTSREAKELKKQIVAAEKRVRFLEKDWHTTYKVFGKTVKATRRKRIKIQKNAARGTTRRRRIAVPEPAAAGAGAGAGPVNSPNTETNTEN